MVVRYRKDVTAERFFCSPQQNKQKANKIRSLGPKLGIVAKVRFGWDPAESVIHAVPLQLNLLHKRRLRFQFGQPDSIPALVLPSGGMTVRPRKSTTAERFIMSRKLVIHRLYSK
ncbi:hypothetical protein CSKR_104557 [Clonorchis sinensis]|uniref:Uncharacterized protein n=1 Tax=Clonorchis sinensis TaxID=79923 RepID=A0A419PEF8_CLOSI|nr:hypothetical protein CSKR_104557 [Clonorchis sinensis]